MMICRLVPVCEASIVACARQHLRIEPRGLVCQPGEQLISGQAGRRQVARNANQLIRQMAAARMIWNRRFTSAGPSGIAEKDWVHVRDYQFKGAQLSLGLRLAAYAELTFTYLFTSLLSIKFILLSICLHVSMGIKDRACAYQRPCIAIQLVP